MTWMRRESLAAPDVIEALLGEDEAAYRGLAERLRAKPPASVVTVARGSSDHAANYAAYLIGAALGLPVASLPPSLVTLYGSKLRVRDGLALAVSQSGQSPDLVATLGACAKSGACTVAIVNDAGSPVARTADFTLPLRAGREQSVAATKSYLASLAAIARLVGTWAGDEELLRGLRELPSVLRRAQELPVEGLVRMLEGARNLFVLGRGPAWTTSLEAALKLKETSGLQAEAFTDAEVKHGPMAIVGQGYPVLVFAPRGPVQAGLVAQAEAFRREGAQVFLAATEGVPGADLAVPAAPHPWLDPLVLIQVFYLAVEALSRARGLNPDEPPRLNKVTRTV